MKYILDVTLKTVACILLAGILWMQVKAYEKVKGVIQLGQNGATIQIAQPIEVVGYSGRPRRGEQPVEVEIVH